MARMARLYVPLDVEFASDPKILSAGPHASYLYICALAYCKRAGKGGVLDRRQLRAIAPGLGGNVTKLAAICVEVGLWEETDDGWSIPSWTKHNLTADQLEQRKRDASAKSQKANHIRHHVEKDVKAAECPLCYPDDSGSQQGPLAVPTGTIPGPKEKRRDREGKGIEKELKNASSSVDGSSSAPAGSADDGVIDKIIKICAARRTEAQLPRPDDPNAYADTIGRQMQRTERSAVAAMLLTYPHYRATPEKAASAYETRRKHTTERSA